MTPVRLNYISALTLMLLKSDLCIFCIGCQAKFSNGVAIRAGESKVLQVKPKEGDTAVCGQMLKKNLHYTAG